MSEPPPALMEWPTASPARAAVRVKICGITSPADAWHAAEAGADAIGLVFADSPRKVSETQAMDVVRGLPPFITPIGLFVNTDPNEIRRICTRVGLTCVQLHGTEPPTVMAALAPLTVIKVFRIADAHSISGVRLWLERAACPPAGVLYDAYHPSVTGGTGLSFDWSLIPPPEMRDERPPLVLAGGLTPSNVAAAVRQVRPYGVDVSSGVELSAGVKDLARMKAFVQAARGA